jgi:hypothetical protein
MGRSNNSHGRCTWKERRSEVSGWKKGMKKDCERREQGVTCSAAVSRLIMGRATTRLIWPNRQQHSTYGLEDLGSSVTEGLVQIRSDQIRSAARAIRGRGQIGIPRFNSPNGPRLGSTTPVRTTCFQSLDTAACLLRWTEFRQYRTVTTRTRQ